MYSFETLRTFLITVAYCSLFSLAAADKIISPAPQWFVDKVNNTLLANLPGGAFAQYWIILLLELFAAIGFLVSFLRLEFFSKREKPILKTSLLLGMFVFIILGSGQRIFAQWGDDVSGFQGASNAFSYFGVTLLCLFILERDSNESSSTKKK